MTGQLEDILHILALFGIFLSIIEGRPDNLTFELNQVFSNLEKLIVFTEKEKLNILSKKDNGNTDA